MHEPIISKMQGSRTRKLDLSFLSSWHQRHRLKVRFYPNRTSIRLLELGSRLPIPPRRRSARTRWLSQLGQKWLPSFLKHKCCTYRCVRYHLWITPSILLQMQACCCSRSNNCWSWCVRNISSVQCSDRNLWNDCCWCQSLLKWTYLPMCSYDLMQYC